MQLNLRNIRIDDMIWIIIGIVMLFVIVYVYKNQRKIEEWVISKFKKENK